MFRIAETIGGRTVAELSRSISWLEVIEWAAYFNLKVEGEQNAQVVAEAGDPDVPLPKDHPDYAAAALMAGLMGGGARRG
jgi:hypothetical protein